MSAADFRSLNDVGLNLQAIFNVPELPEALVADIRQRFDPAAQFRQLILIGHGGKRLWEAVKESGNASPDPIDDFSAASVRDWLGEVPYRLIYPAEESIGLQALGKLAGWHHASPFMVGINAAWGSWYAYRVVALAATNYAVTPGADFANPCLTCDGKPCIPACPAEAVSSGAFKLEKCIAWRKLPDSPCQSSCLARIACPVAVEHRYPPEQIRHAYTISLRMIEQHA